MKDRLSELENKIGTLEAETDNQTLTINQLKAENKNQTLKNNQFEAEIENQTLKIKQLEAENFNLHQMLQDRNDSYGNLNFLLSFILKIFLKFTKITDSHSLI